VALTTHPHLEPRLQKEKSYTYTPPLGLCGLFWGEIYLYICHQIRQTAKAINEMLRTTFGDNMMRRTHIFE